MTEAAPDGEDERWVVSGRVEVDNKGNVVRQYEPFYADEVEFDFSPAGVSAVLEYDPIGRNIRMTLPDGNVRSWTYTPWQVSASDENDNDTGGDFEDTPAVTHLDSLGRVYKVAELTEISGTPLLTALTLDIQGNPRAVIDPRGNTIQVQTFDMLGRPLFTGAADEGYDPGPPENDKGQTRALLDVASKPFRTWRSGDLALKQTCDQARRPLGLYVTEDSVTRLVTLTIYGDAVSDPPAHSLSRPIQVYDTAGRVSLSYDFRGRVIEQTRQLHTEVETESNWTGLEEETSLANIESWLGTNADLETTTYTTTTTYDALDRPTEQITPDSSRTVPGYNPGGQLTSVQVYVRGAEDPTEIVTEITYNARGQRETITYGNYTTTTTTYDPDRLWPTQILTERSSSSPHGAATLQDLSYTRDPVGNITQITDAAQETLYFDNTQVSPTRSFSYDALYRLTTATGREKSGLTQATPRWSDCGGATGGLPDTGDGESGSSPVLRRYTEVYTYDAAGNLTEVKHSNGTGGTVLWKRGYRVADLNNQLERTSISTDTYTNPDSYSDTYTYNDRGAMTYLPHLKTGAGDNLTRDYRDQIRRADIDTSGTVAHYAYDAAGQRSRKGVVRTGVVEERITLGSYEVWRKKNLAGDIDEERETVHVLDGERRAALIETLTWEDETELSTPETRIRYQLDDHLGTASVELDEDGATISYEEYHPYGTTAWYADDGTLEGSPKRYRYTGMERDEETGLQYHSARHYAPWLGRWCSADPIGLGDGANRQVYCHGHPTQSIDPQGFQDTSQNGAGQFHPEPWEKSWSGNPIVAVSVNRQGPRGDSVSIEMVDVRNPGELWPKTEFSNCRQSGVRINSPGPLKPTPESELVDNDFLMDLPGARRLSTAEINEARKVYGDAIDYSKVVIFQGYVLPDDYVRKHIIPRIPNGRLTPGFTPPINAMMLRSDMFNNDGTLNPAGMETLIHELTHIWQFQRTGYTYATKSLSIQTKDPTSRSATYNAWEAAVIRGEPFCSMNVEAQGDAMQTYYRTLKAIESGTFTKDDVELLARLRPYVRDVQRGIGAP